jgi:large subunit ribosomal protein L31e
MAAKKEPKKILERTYNVPLRKEWLKVPKFRRGKKAVTALRQFISKHMKSDNVKILKFANQEIWKRGIKSPPHHIKINAVKDESGKVLVELFGKPIVEEKPKEEKKVAKKEEKKTEKEEKLEEKRKETVETEAEVAKEIEKEEIKEERKQTEVLPHPKASELKEQKHFQSEKPDYRAPKGDQGTAHREHHKPKQK